LSKYIKEQMCCCC